MIELVGLEGKGGILNGFLVKVTAREPTQVADRVLVEVDVRYGADERIVGAQEIAVRGRPRDVGVPRNDGEKQGPASRCTLPAETVY